MRRVDCCLPNRVSLDCACATGIGNMDNARALFERALIATPAPAAAKLWDAFLAFEYRHGKLPAALAIQVHLQMLLRQSVCLGLTVIFEGATCDPVLYPQHTVCTCCVPSLVTLQLPVQRCT